MVYPFSRSLSSSISSSSLSVLDERTPGTRFYDAPFGNADPA